MRSLRRRSAVLDFRSRKWFGGGGVIEDPELGRRWCPWERAVTVTNCGTVECRYDGPPLIKVEVGICV
ncbi:hypothetical protein PROFUN_04872 [Planoprotostelium fungivorum]|uniref:Uncharacterized protein n=1 Tax=Planoprotostelium fungivorum TaxID=1890364 RepID=A0A2P6NF39_9EUKA|nr:hypothetical protein PROFUN_04872 [Planoprotostelium fungivorum]